MKGKLKQIPANVPSAGQAGITLIALIITIIILLILAVVSIRLVINNGILDKSKYAVDKYSEEERAEQAKLLEAEYEMAKYEGKATGSFTDYVLETKYNGVKIGDYVNYTEAGEDYTADTSKGVGRSATKNSTTGRWNLTAGNAYTTENLGWRVLGVNSKGELELISDNPTTDTLYLANEEGYLYGPDELNKMCNKLYGNGTDANGKVVATGARSLNVDDINKLAGITTEEQKKSLNSGYGDVWTWRFPTTDEVSGTRYMQYKTDNPDGTQKKDWTNITNTRYQKFRMPGQEEAIGKISEDNIKEGTTKPLERTYYYYNIAEKIKDSKISEMITNGTGTRSNVYNWLASTSISCEPDYAGFYVRCVYYGDVILHGLHFSDHISCSDSYAYRIRPVVSLKSDIQIDESNSSKDGTSAEKAYEIK